eukprot:1143370-Amphidinium_carterae.1
MVYNGNLADITFPCIPLPTGTLSCFGGVRIIAAPPVGIFLSGSNLLTTDMEAREEVFTAQGWDMTETKHEEELEVISLTSLASGERERDINIHSYT